jgi:hypothetical protein
MMTHAQHNAHARLTQNMTERGWNLNVLQNPARHAMHSAPRPHINCLCSYDMKTVHDFWHVGAFQIFCPEDCPAHDHVGKA